MAALPMSRPLNDGWKGDRLKPHCNHNFGEVSNLAPDAQTVVNKPVFGGEALRPIKYLILGVTAHLAVRRGARGGARNSASRESLALTTAQVKNLTAAAAHASVIGLPLTRLITIHWRAAGVPLEGMVKATGHFVDLMSKALKRKGVKTAWIWVHENVTGDKGWHCHLLAHIPAKLSQLLAGSQKRWLRSITGNAYRARVIDGRPIGGRLGIETGNPAVYCANLDETLSYVCKGAAEAAAEALSLKRYKPGGLIIGKRCATSQNISLKSRKTYRV